MCDLRSSRGTDGSQLLLQVQIGAGGAPRAAVVRLEQRRGAAAGSAEHKRPEEKASAPASASASAGEGGGGTSVDYKLEITHIRQVEQGSNEYIQMVS